MQYPFSIYFLNFFVQKVRKRALNRFVFVKKTTLCGRTRRQPSAVFMQVQKNRLTNYSNEYKLRAKVIQMHNNFANGKEERGCGDARCVLRRCRRGKKRICGRACAAG